ncbi:MAG: ISAs1 family transposase [Proteobacteria bacterium]|nr:ISAs1 family transposase [Pseudomonadota bacterium]
MSDPIGPFCSKTIVFRQSGFPQFLNAIDSSTNRTSPDFGLVTFDKCGFFDRSALFWTVVKLGGICNRHSRKSAIHMVSAWAAENRIVLGQVKTEEKSNEITAIPELLEVLDISGCIVTIDAMGC